MSFNPHPDSETIPLNCAAITISDTRTTVTDSSGKVIKALLSNAGHRVTVSIILPDEPSEISAQLVQLGDCPDLDVIIFNGGTGIGPRDTTYDAICSLLEKTLPGFGELFRFLSYQEISSRAMTSRAVAGVYRRKFVFSLPGSTNAVKLAMDKLIIPELTHLINLL